MRTCSRRSLNPSTLGRAALLLIMAACWGPQASAAVVDSRWIAGTGSWSNPDRWDPAVLPNNLVNTFSVHIDGGDLATASSVHLDMNITIDALAVDADDRLTMDHTLTVQGGPIANAGVVVLQDGGTLRIGRDSTLNGLGTLVLQHLDNARIVGVSGTQRLTNDGSNIVGYGQVGGNSLKLTNRGVIEANVPWSWLYVDPSSGDNGVVNTATMRASNEGVLQLEAGTYNNDQGVIEALAGSRVLLANGAVIQKGTLSSSGDGRIRSVNGSQTTVTLSDVTNLAVLEIGIDSTVQLMGTVTNNGSITFQGPGTLTQLRVLDDVTLKGTGTVTLQNHDKHRIDGSPSTSRLTNAGNTIQGFGYIGQGSLKLTNEGVIQANVKDGWLRIAPNADADGLINKGTLRATQEGILQLQSGTCNNQGVIEAVGGTVLFAPDLTVANYDAQTKTLTGGTWRSAGTLDFGDRPIVTNAAEIILSGTSSVFAAVSGLSTNAATGKFNLLNGRNFSTAGTLTNNGTLAITGSTLTTTGDLLMDKGSSYVCGLSGKANGLITGKGNVFLNTETTLALQVSGYDMTNPSWGDSTRTIITAAGARGVEGKFATVPATDKYLGFGTFFKGVTYEAKAVKVKVSQAAPGDTWNDAGNKPGPDKTIDVSDIQQILRMAKFNSGKPAVWNDGDFNDDGLVTPADIQLVLATNLFKKGPYAAGSDALTLDSPSALLKVTPEGLLIDTQGLTLNGFVVTSKEGLLTGEPAENLGLFQVDNDQEISGQMLMAISGQHLLGNVLGETDGVDLLGDLSLSYTAEGYAGIYQGVVVVPEPAVLVMVLSGAVVALLVTWRRRRAT